MVRLQLLLRVSANQLAFHQLLERLPSPWERAAPLVLHQVVEAVHGDGLARLRVHQHETGDALNPELLRQLVLWEARQKEQRSGKARLSQLVLFEAKQKEQRSGKARLSQFVLFEARQKSRGQARHG